MDTKEILKRIFVDIERSRMYGVGDDDITIIMTYSLYARLAGGLGVVLAPEYSTLFGCRIRVLYDSKTEEWFISTVHGAVREEDI